ncbi:hypothetical protein [Candidatus Manganitrophus noduliformans]|uniref:Uncharacterized protein n=1 Tax=Candidatus Manganitrophus noduliformans TaxID=2606439 RepID=A0A7X6DTM9_9BACT|nr:hypothetical protein [Candidatus Manganitrophus noduliformans]NKE72964.1 hypothetical protein [Candidatus Manganitrophus noduliformans]
MLHLLFTAVIAAFVEAVLKLLLDHLFGIEKLSLITLIIMFFSLYFLIFLIHLYVKRNRDKLKKLRGRFGHWLVGKFHKVIYLPADRESETYKKLITEKIKESKRVYLRLLSGYTMVWDDRENYVFKALQGLSREQLRRKDVRIQFLSREAPEFEPRGRWYVEKMRRDDVRYRCDNFDHYKERCAEIEANIRMDLPEIKLEFYNRAPLWRLFIFDDNMFVSNYYAPDGEREEGHMNTAVELSREEGGTYNPIYVGLMREFQSLGRSKPMLTSTN